MIEFFPEKENIDATELTAVYNWLNEVAQGKRKNWPGYPVSVRVNGKTRQVANGTWEYSERETNTIYIGNGAAPAPIWAASVLMAIARYYRLDDDKIIVGRIHAMLTKAIAREIIPVMNGLATTYNGTPIIEIAVDRKGKTVVGRGNDPDGKPGPFRHLSGEVAEVNEKDWIILKM